MIIKFDHITYSASRSQFDIKLFASKQIKFQEWNLRNPEGKKDFMYNQWSDADLFYMEGQIPVEVVLYEGVVEKTDVDVDDTTIKCFCKKNSLENLDSLLCTIGFKVCTKRKGENIYKISGVFDKQEVYLVVKEKVDLLPILLDSGGWNCPCFLVDSVTKLFERLSAEECICSSVDKLMVNHRELEIGFLKNENLSIILEFIAPVVDS